MITTGNTILITGGGSGIGRGLAEAFQARGNQVIITGRRASALDATVTANPGMVGRQLDVTDAGAIRRFATDIVAEFPKLNVVINNAGIMMPENVQASTDTEIAEKTVTTNLLGPIRLTAALLPHLLVQPRATVMMVSSGLAFVPLAGTPTYSATKAAIHSYAQSLRYQLKDTKVQVIEIAPPYVQTELTGPGQASDPMAMPLADYLKETVHLLETQPEADENLVKNVMPLRSAESSGGYSAFFKGLNDMFAARH